MELKYGKDYETCFDVKSYLDAYYSEASLGDESMQSSLRCFYEFWCLNAPVKNARVLEFGGGGNISSLISATPQAKEIIFTEYSEVNRKAVEAWQQNSPDSFDWSHCFTFIVKCLEKKKEIAHIKDREDELKRKITHILPCDIWWEDPVKWSSLGPQWGTFDVVSTSFCIEAAVTTEEGYRQAIVRLRKYLKPGGYLLMMGMLGETYYMVGTEKFFAFPLRKSFIEETLRSQGFDELHMQSFRLDPSHQHDAHSLLFVSAKLQHRH